MAKYLVEDLRHIELGLQGRCYRIVKASSPDKVKLLQKEVLICNLKDAKYWQLKMVRNLDESRPVLMTRKQKEVRDYIETVSGDARE